MKQYLCGRDYFTEYKWDEYTSTELECFPEDRSYRDANFMWRASIDKTIDKRPTLRRMPNYENNILVLSGSANIIHEGLRSAQLEVGDQDRFEGAVKTRMEDAKIKYINFMVRKGNEVYVDLKEATPEWNRSGLEEEVNRPFKTIVFYVTNGYIEVSTKSYCEEVNAGELYVIEFEKDDEVFYSVKGDGQYVRAQIFFGKYKEKIAPPVGSEIPQEKATFKDFLYCVYVANLSSKVAKYAFPKRKDEWFVPALSKVTKRLDNMHLGAWIFAIAAMLIFRFTMVDGQVGPTTIYWLIGTFIVDVLLIVPFIFFLFVPKPVAKHIKPVKSLNAYERMLREEEIENDIRDAKAKQEKKMKGINILRK